MAGKDPRILFAWELGGGLGHLTRIAPLARALRTCGAEVDVAASDLARAAAWLDASVGLHQCPLAGSARVAVGPQYNYAALLARAGWLDAVALDGVLRAWDGLLDALRPDVLVCDFAPTGLLAATGRPISVAALGNGFDLPPPTQPLPVMSWWEPVDNAAMASTEASVLAAVNAALARRGVAGYARLADLFACDWRAAMTLEAFDPYPDRPHGDIEFVGLPETAESALRPPWPGRPGARGFVYLRGERGHVEAVVAALRALRCSALVCATGLDAAAAAELSTDAIRVFIEPLALTHALEGADFVVTHSGTGLGASAIAAGKPVVLLPLYREQLMVARRLAEAGVAKYVLPDRLGDAWAAIEAVALQPESASAARLFAARLPVPSNTSATVAARLLELAAKGRSPR
jgi:UDP:flavonoid glycosyltransferase YjiC (YdhE family)